MAMRWVGLLWWLAIALAVVGACSSSGGDDHGASTGGTSSTTPFGTSACGTCVASACQTERTACLSDPGCASFASCVDACPVAAGGNADAACVAGCPAPSSSAGVSAMTALEACRISGAGAQCAGCGGADAGSDATSADNPILAPQGCTQTGKAGCYGCIVDNCCKLKAECLGDPDCDALSNCVAACSGWACESACFSAHEGSVAKYSRYYGCASIFCPGSDQDCKTAPNPTIECVVVNDCRQQYADCYSQADCYLITQCAMDCSDASCYEDCKNAYPSGISAFGAMTLCWEKKCAFTP